MGVGFRIQIQAVQRVRNRTCGGCYKEPPSVSLMLVIISDTLEGSAGDDCTLLDDVHRSTNRTVFLNPSSIAFRSRADDVSGWERRTALSYSHPLH